MAKWTIDTTHSEVGFRVKHLMINNVKGHFNKFDLQVESEGDDFKDSEISFSAETASIDTGNEQRDQHLKSADFFDSEKYPTLTFKANSYQNGKLKGDLTIMGKTNPVTLDVEFGGIMKDPWGNTKAGFTVNGKINRKDWDLTWNAALETGGVLVSEDVWINCEIQLLKQV